ncbi:MAG: ABC transporter substrate-binding protein [Chloroflexi bacterium]|nr:ABC transporter substrate-binding protein [Chloroflexota bacterium]MCL5735667.1 ABC transporter substrate-binding protein [Actinomycetota bacterium]
MNARDDKPIIQRDEGHFERAVSRRSFLKMAGIAAASIGTGGSLAALLAGCGGESVTTTSATATSTSTAAGVVTTSGATTTVSSGPEAGDPVKIGFVTPQTGPLAAFGIPDKYCMDRANESFADGLVCGDGKKHPVSISMQDSQSDTNRAAQVTGDLINNEGVQLIVAASTGTTVPPVADQCEASGVPLLSTDCTWEQFHYGRGLKAPTDSFKWTYLFFFGMSNLVPTYLGLWDLLPNDKVLGGMWPNEVAGNTARPIFTDAAKGKGYTVVDPGAWQPGTEDYTAMISMFKKNAVEVVQGFMTPPDMANFWKQSVQQGFKPKVATIAIGTLFPQAIEAIGEIGAGLTTEVWWTPAWPFKSSLTGETCQQFADEYEARSNSQWTQPLLHYVVFEMAADVLKRASDPTSKDAILIAITTMKLDTIAGTVDFTSPVADNTAHPVPNCYTSPCLGGQWVKGSGKWPFDLKVVYNGTFPAVPTDATIMPLA